MKSPRIISNTYSKHFRFTGLKSIFLGGMAAALVSHPASAGLVWDLRATSLNGVPIDGGTNNIQTVAPGDVIRIDMYAQMYGSAAGAEGFGSSLGKTIGTFSGITGNQSDPVYETDFINPSATLPTRQDLNGDGFFDLGSTAATTSSTVGNWFPRFTGTPSFKQTGTAINTSLGSGIEVPIFHFNFTIATVTPGGRGSIDWIQQTVTTINSATYLIDGTSYTSRTIGTSTPTGQPTAVEGPNANPGLSFGTPIPEPSAFGMIILGAMSLVGFRRTGFRRD